MYTVAILPYRLIPNHVGEPSRTRDATIWEHRSAKQAARRLAHVIRQCSGYTNGAWFVIIDGDGQTYSLKQFRAIKGIH